MKSKFKVGQVVHVRDWKGVWRIGHIKKVDKQEDGFKYMVHWELTDGIYQDEGGIRSLTKCEQGR